MELKGEIGGGVVVAVMVFICQDGTDLDIFWILIESWDPGLTIREAVRRKIVRPSRKNGQ